MNDFTKEEIIYGFTHVPETYCEYIHVQLTKKEKIKIFLYNAKEMIIEILWFLLFTIGLILQIGGLAYIAAIMFKIGLKA